MQVIFPHLSLSHMHSIKSSASRGYRTTARHLAASSHPHTMGGYNTALIILRKFTVHQVHDRTHWTQKRSTWEAALWSEQDNTDNVREREGERKKDEIRPMTVTERYQRYKRFQRAKSRFGRENCQAQVVNRLTKIVEHETEQVRR